MATEPTKPEDNEEGETTTAPTTTPRPHEVVDKDYVRRLKKAEKENADLKGVVDELSGKVDEQNAFLAKLRETPTAGKPAEPASKGVIASAVEEVTNFFFPPSASK